MSTVVPGLSSTSGSSSSREDVAEDDGDVVPSSSASFPSPYVVRRPMSSPSPGYSWSYMTTTCEERFSFVRLIGYVRSYLVVMMDEIRADQLDDPDHVGFVSHSSRMTGFSVMRRNGGFVEKLLEYKRSMSRFSEMSEIFSRIMIHHAPFFSVRFGQGFPREEIPRAHSCVLKISCCSLAELREIRSNIDTDCMVVQGTCFWNDDDLGRAVSAVSSYVDGSIDYLSSLGGICGGGYPDSDASIPSPDSSSGLVNGVEMLGLSPLALSTPKTKPPRSSCYGEGDPPPPSPVRARRRRASNLRA